MPNYEPANLEMINMVDLLLHTQYPDLLKHGVVIGVLMATNPDGPAVKLHGYACAATIKVISLRERARGGPDAEILIDGNRKTGWPSWSEAQRRAVIDHELYHLELCFNDDGLVTDDLGRPRLRLRLHDWQLGGFAEIVRRHGDGAFERVAVRQASEQFGQLFFPWADETRDVDEAAKAVEWSAKSKAKAPANSHAAKPVKGAGPVRSPSNPSPGAPL